MTTRSMAPTIAAVERITPPAGPSVTRLAYSYQRGYEDGYAKGCDTRRSVIYGLLWFVSVAAIIRLVVAWML